MLGYELDALRWSGVTLVRERLESLTLGQALVSLLLEILQNISDPPLWFLLPTEENRNFLSVAWLDDWIKQQGGRELGLRCGGEEYWSSWTGGREGWRGGGVVSWGRRGGELEEVLGERGGGWLVIWPEWRQAGDDHGALASSHWGDRGGGDLAEERVVRVVVEGQGRVGGGHSGGGVGGGNRGEDGEMLGGNHRGVVWSYSRANC